MFSETLQNFYLKKNVRNCLLAKPHVWLFVKHGFTCLSNGPEENENKERHKTDFKRQLEKHLALMNDTFELISETSWKSNLP